MIQNEVFDIIENSSPFFRRLSSNDEVVYNLEEFIINNGIPVIRGILSQEINLKYSLVNHYSKDFPSFCKNLIANSNSNTGEGLELNDKTIEFNLLLREKKPTVRFVASINDLLSIYHYCKSNSLLFLISPFSFPVLNDSILNYSNIINNFTNVTYSNANGVFVYLSNDISALFTVWVGELLGDHRAVGQMLGYPLCCIEFYQKHLEDVNRKFLGDFSLPAFYNENSSIIYNKFPIWSNNLSRYFSESLISHFPCSYHCKKTIRLAKEYYKSINLERKKDILLNLQGLFIFSKNHGVICLRDYQIEEYSIRYNPLSVNVTNKNSYFSQTFFAGNVVKFKPTDKAFQIFHGSKKLINIRDDVYLADFVDH